MLALLGAGLAAAGGQFGITAAYYHAPAKEISIYDYSQIIFSTILGYFLFGQVPDKYSVLGYVIILAMAAWMFFYNKRPEEKEQKLFEAKYISDEKDYKIMDFARLEKNIIDVIKDSVEIMQVMKPVYNFKPVR